MTSNNTAFTILSASLALGISAHAASVGVANPSFHADRFGSPGYGLPTGWGSTAGGVGVNPATGGGSPFSSGANVPDGGDFALIQGDGNLFQSFSGLDPSQTYALQFYAAGRDCCGGTGNLAVTYGAQSLLPATLMPGVGAGGNYTFFDIPFTPATAAADLSFVTTTAFGTDYTVFLDAISLFTRTADQLVIANPSFEGSGNIGGVGYYGATSIGGWSFLGGGYGVNSAAGPFYDNGVNPDGVNVAFIQGNGTLSQTVGGFAIGSQYQLSYSYNTRDAGEDSTLQVLIGGLEAQNSAVAPVGAGNPFFTNTFSFTATNTAMLLEFAETGTVGDRSVLLDNVSIRLIPEPSSGLLGLLGAGILLARRRRR